MRMSQMLALFSSEVVATMKLLQRTCVIIYVATEQTKTH